MNVPVTGKYASAALPPHKDSKGYYFADALVDAVVEAARPVIPAAFAHHVTQEAAFERLEGSAPHTDGAPIPLERGKEIIIAALQEFDPALGAKATEILHDTRRLDSTQGQQCRPAGATEDWSKNPEPYAIIELEYDGTMNSLVYLAHELGHAIADDYGHEAGHSYRNNPEHMQETQAYFVQSILYDHLSRIPELAQAAEQHFTATMTKNLYNVPVALIAKQAEQNIQKGQEFQSSAIKDWFGEDWQKHPRADEMFDTAQAVNKAHRSGETQIPSSLRTELDRQIEGLHYRPMSLLVAAGLFDKLAGQDQATRHHASEVLLGRQGAKPIDAAFDAAGINGIKDIRDMTQTTIQRSTASVFHAADAGQDLQQSRIVAASSAPILPTRATR